MTIQYQPDNNSIGINNINTNNNRMVESNQQCGQHYGSKRRSFSADRERERRTKRVHGAGAAAPLIFQEL